MSALQEHNLVGGLFQARLSSASHALVHWSHQDKEAACPKLIWHDHLFNFFSEKLERVFKGTLLRNRWSRDLLEWQDVAYDGFLLL